MTLWKVMWSILWVIWEAEDSWRWAQLLEGTSRNFEEGKDGGPPGSIFPVWQYHYTLCLVETKMLENLACQLVWGMDPVIFLKSLWTPGSVTRECVQPFCFRFKEKRIVSRGGSLHIVPESKTINSVSSKSAFQEGAHPRLDSEGGGISFSKFGHIVCNNVQIER